MLGRWTHPAPSLATCLAPNLLTSCLLAPCLLALFLLAPGAAAGSVTHCDPAETIVYSCASGKQIVSLCASRDVANQSGYLQYRFGPKGKPVLVFPADRTPPDHHFVPGNFSFAGGGGAYLQFEIAPYTYTVLSAIGNWGPRGAKATVDGVSVQKQGKVLANYACRADANEAEGEFGPDFFEKIGLGESRTDFEIPDAFFKKGSRPR
ncbi:hypothetical protein [Methylocapsa palsarum]|nr:hypothetical protein [Methylocapsa palsarum]